MNYLPTKDHLLYLVLISVLIFLGPCFTQVVMGDNDIGLKIFAILFFFINSIVVYCLVEDLFKSSFISLTSAMLYLAAPTHLDVFFYEFQIQSLIAEMFLLFFFISLKKRRTWIGLSFLMVALLLNTKFIILMFFLLPSRLFSIPQKLAAIGVFVVIFIYLLPLYFMQSFFLSTQFRTVFYMLGNLFFPGRYSLLNYAILEPGYLSIFSTLALFIGLGSLCLVFYKKHHYILSLVTAFLVISLLGSFVPFKQVVKTTEYFYYYLPSFYPMVVYSFILAFAYLISKIAVHKKITFVTCVLIIGFWTASNVLIQRHFLNVAGEWSYAMDGLPKDIHHELNVRLKYAQVLVDDGQFENAKMLINKFKLKNPSVEWYVLLLTMASKEKNILELERIYKELNESGLPYINDSYNK